MDVFLLPQEGLLLLNEMKYILKKKISAVYCVSLEVAVDRGFTDKRGRVRKNH
jgi:hypothetical protein